jgi:hypothetical protein
VKGSPIGENNSRVTRPSYGFIHFVGNQWTKDSVNMNSGVIRRKHKVRVIPPAMRIAVVELQGAIEALGTCTNKPYRISGTDMKLSVAVSYEFGKVFDCGRPAGITITPKEHISHG